MIWSAGTWFISLGGEEAGDRNSVESGAVPRPTYLVEEKRPPRSAGPRQHAVLLSLWVERQRQCLVKTLSLD